LILTLICNLSSASAAFWDIDEARKIKFMIYTTSVSEQKSILEYCLSSPRETHVDEPAPVRALILKNMLHVCNYPSRVYIHRALLDSCLYHSGAPNAIVTLILIRVHEPPKEFDQGFDSYYTCTADGVGGTVI
jgi:hypothetical protein